MTLPYDISRCAGMTSDLCQVCRRIEPGRAYWQVHIAPAWDVVNGCVNFIPPTETTAANGTEGKK